MNCPSKLMVLVASTAASACPRLVIQEHPICYVLSDWAPQYCRSKFYSDIVFQMTQACPAWRLISSISAAMDISSSTADVSIISSSSVVTSLAVMYSVMVAIVVYLLLSAIRPTPPFSQPYCGFTDDRGKNPAPHPPQIHRLHHVESLPTLL